MMVTFKSPTLLYLQKTRFDRTMFPQNQIAAGTKFVSYFVPDIFKWVV